MSAIPGCPLQVTSYITTTFISTAYIQNICEAVLTSSLLTTLTDTSALQSGTEVLSTSWEEDITITDTLTKPGTLETPVSTSGLASGEFGSTSSDTEV